MWGLAAGRVEPQHIALCLLFCEDGTPFDSNSTLLYVPSIKGMFLFFKISFSRLNDTHSLNRLIICGLRIFFKISSVRKYEL